ncbi:MAG: hypothetical protein WCF12_16080 [Propionicimonas sp.]
MNTTSGTTVNTKAATAVMAVSLLFAVLFGSPVGSTTPEPDTAVVSLQAMGQ